MRHLTFGVKTMAALKIETLEEFRPALVFITKY